MQPYHTLLSSVFWCFTSLFQVAFTKYDTHTFAGSGSNPVSELKDVQDDGNGEV